MIVPTHKKERPTLTCEHCGTTFHTRRLISKGNPAPRYCSLACVGAARRGIPLGERATGHIDLTCLHCGKTWSAYPSRVERLFCSRACSDAYKTVTLTCKQCGRLFTVPRSRADKQYCSHRCYGMSMKGQPTNRFAGRKPYSPMAYYYGADWPEIVKQVRERDNYTCQMCGIHQSQRPRALSVHHIRPYRSFGPAAFNAAHDLSNLITLCQPCHRKVDKGLIELIPRPR
jgi:5-methylcytosine-specific restriction endonuclease McrA